MNRHDGAPARNETGQSSDKLDKQSEFLRIRLRSWRWMDGACAPKCCRLALDRVRLAAPPSFECDSSSL